MNVLDRIIAVFDPAAALRRRAARNVLAQYEAAEPSRLRKFHRGGQPQNALVARAAVSIREQARNLYRNHDIAKGALNTMVNNVVGPSGIGVEPQPRRKDGSIDKEYAKELLELYVDWCKRPETTHQHHWSSAQRLVALTWFRDGECFAQRLMGQVPLLDHGSRVPFSLELIEPDMVPINYGDGNTIHQGIERNAWGKPVGYWVYKTTPSTGITTLASDLKRIGFESMYHLATRDHIGQLRGISTLASVITRLEDIKDYEESERVAAKIAAMLTAYVKKGNPDLYGASEGAEAAPRNITFQPGMVIDDLAVGEEIGLIDSKRPNPGVMTFRNGQLAAAAAGIGISKSSLTKTYDGTYSAQRQELVEQWVNYAILTDDFTGYVVRPVWEDFVLACDLSGVLPIPRDLKPGTAADAMYVATSMPWIDPLKEALANEALCKAGFDAPQAVIRRRGANPEHILEQNATWRQSAAARGLNFTVFNPDNGAASTENQQDSAAAGAGA